MHLREDTMSLDSSSEDPIYYLKIKDLEKELLFGGNVAPAPPGKYFQTCIYWHECWDPLFFSRNGPKNSFVCRGWEHNPIFDNFVKMENKTYKMQYKDGKILWNKYISANLVIFYEKSSSK